MRASGRLWVVAVLLCATAVAACTPGVAPSGDPLTQPGQPSGPFEVRIDDIKVSGMDNAEILGRPATPIPDEGAEAAAAGARDALGRFLTAQLVDEATRFSAAPIDALLTDRARAALTEEDRAALGQLDLAVDRTITGPAATTATVLMDGPSPHAATLGYTALATVVAEDGTRAGVRYTGTMTFVPTEDGWRAEAVDVSLEVS